MGDEQKFLSDIYAEEESVPPLLYKYCSIETAKKILSSSAVMLSSPLDFNDPFDTRFQWLSPTPEEWRERGKTKRYHELAKAYEATKSIPPPISRFIKSTGISCFSETRDDICMWGHYAEKHGGVCLGFISGGMFYTCHCRVQLEASLFLCMMKVHYKRELPAWKLTDPPHLTMDRIRRKAPCWSYEKEWRLIVYDMAGKIWEFPKEILAEIIFGVKATDESIEEIRKLAIDKGYSPKFIQAKKSATKYEIEFVPCPD